MNDILKSAKKLFDTGGLTKYESLKIQIEFERNKIFVEIKKGLQDIVERRGTNE